MGELTAGQICVRVLLAFAAGMLVGWERECHGRPAGLRTNILACVAAAVAMIASEVLFVQSAAVSFGGTIRSDPARLGAGILTGIGFLGAGTILRHDNFVRGVTTAATLWFVTVLGLAFGAGFFVLGGVGLAVAMATLLVLPRLEKLAQSDWYAVLTVTAELQSLDEDGLKQRVEALGPRVMAMKLNYDLQKREKTFTCDLKLKRPERFNASSRVVAALSQAPGVLRVTWE